MKGLGLVAGIVGAWGLVQAAGCVATLDQNRARQERRDLPAVYGAHGDESNGAGASTSLVAQERWDAFFSDPNLRALIVEALQNNQELGIRVQEIIIARNEVAARRGEILPRVDVGAGAGFERASESTSQGVSDEAHGLPATLGDFNYGLMASWEVDIWGKLRKAAAAADNRYLATNEAKNFMITELVGELASLYFELIALDNQLGVLEGNIKILEDALEVVTLQKQAARATELAVQKFQAEILRLLGTRYSLEQRRVQAENRINIMVGRFPQPVARASRYFDGRALGTIRTGLPSALLENRPDVREAELQLEAARLDVDVARARFYPSLTIDARIGYRAFNPLHLLSIPESLTYGLAAGVMMPLVNRAGIAADYRAANARQIQAVMNFERTLLRAYTEVVTQLARTENLARRYEQQSLQVETLKRAVDVSSLLYQSARADYMEVLMTRRDSLEAQVELIETQEQKMRSLVSLYQALGGGWRHRDTPTPRTQRPPTTQHGGQEPQVDERHSPGESTAAAPTTPSR